MKNALPSISTVLRRWLLLGTLGAFVIVSSTWIFLQYRLALRDIRDLLQITVMRKGIRSNLITVG